MLASRLQKMKSNKNVQRYGICRTQKGFVPIKLIPINPRTIKEILKKICLKNNYKHYLES